MTRPHAGGTDDRHDDEGADPPRGRGARAPVGDRSAVARDRAAVLRARTSCGSAVRSASSTRSPAWARGGCGSCCAQRDYVAALGAMTGGQAVEMLKAGLEAIYLSGWQVAADANLSGQTYPDQSLYPANSVPAVVRRLNNALMRADQIAWSEGSDISLLPPIVADAEAGFGGALNAFELMRSMIEAGAAGVHFEDQLASEKKCGHLGGKVLVPDGAVRPDADGRPSGRRRARRPVARRRADRRPRGHAAHVRCRRARRALHDRHADARGVLPGARRDSTPRSRAGSRTRPYADMLWCETVHARPGPGAGVRRRDPLRVPGQAPGVQLLAVVQLEAAPGRHRDRAVPEGARVDGLPVPVHHARGFPRAEREHVRAGARLRRGRA